MKPGSTSMRAAYAASLSMLLVCMSVFAVNMALPAIAANLGGDVTSQQWLISGYTLPFAALLIASGEVSDRFGAKRTLALASLAYGIASAICPFAQTIEMLIALQAVLGSIGAFVLPSSMSLIGEAYQEGTQRAHALMLWGIGGSSASAIGPLTGGAVVQLHWGLAFAINVPFCITIALLCANVANNPKSRKGTSFDALGLMLGTAGLASFVAGIISLSNSDSSVMPTVLCLSGVALLLLFALQERKSKHPVLPTTLFTSKETRLALLSGFAMIFAWNGSVFACTLLLQGNLGFSPLENALAFAPAAITCMLGNLVGERLAKTHRVSFVLVCGGVVLLLGYFTLALCSHCLSPAIIAVAISLAGMGGAIVTPVLAALVLTHNGGSESGAASAAFNAMRQVGGTIGVAVYGACLSLASFFENGFLAAAAISALMLTAMLVGFIRIR